MRRLALVLFGAAALVACSRASKAAKKDQPAAVGTVNGEPIAVSYFQQELLRARADTGDGDVPADALKARVVNEIVEQRLLLQQARARSVQVPQDQVERAFLRVRSEYPGSHFDDLLAEERISAADLKNRLRDQLTVEKLFNDEVFPRIQVTDDEIQRYYEEHPAEFDQPEQVHVLQIVAKTKDEATRLRDQVRRKPATFGDVARSKSIAPEGKVGGDLGWFGKGEGMPEVFDACLKLPVGQISDVTPSPYGFHIFKVTEKRPARKIPFADAKTALAQKLLRDKRAKAQAEYLAALKQKAAIKIDAAAVAAVSLSSQ